MLLQLLNVMVVAHAGSLPHKGPAREVAADPAALLQRAVAAAIAANAPLVTVAAGTYNFGNRTFLIAGARDLEIRAAGHVVRTMLMLPLSCSCCSCRCCSCCYSRCCSY